MFSVSPSMYELIKFNNGYYELDYFLEIFCEIHKILKGSFIFTKVVSFLQYHCCERLEYAAMLHGRDWYIYRCEFLHNDFGTPRLDIIVMRSGLRVKFLLLSPTKLGSIYLFDD